MVDPVTETDLIAYVDGELDPMRRVEVEAHLARNPQDALQVMADLRDRDALREAFLSVPSLPPERLRASARRIDRAFAWQRVRSRMRRAAAVVVLVGAGWLAHTESGSFGVPGSFASPIDPSLAEEAKQAREAVQIRARVTSQFSVASAYDPAALEAATGVDLPPLPKGWVVRDVQIFPSRNGTGIEVSIQSAEIGELALFAKHSSGTLPAEGAEPVARSSDGTTAYWRNGNTAYALSGSRNDPALHAAAARLAAIRE
ncbi:anti-sigma factor family protein [Methylobacterium sp. R2-1]|uniref:anti-sigma factor family protein n=1 Tax=Methylobacterium sp. R2-1 TaxID=2587064 RepID=UPI00160EE300|nr:zf-HC2 domain-containing protein [Methylobacterium sp. R2-1]MBB2960605.1 anti-sigma factor RsiW [Methylobacterium sp. R2-1]